MIFLDRLIINSKRNSGIPREEDFETTYFFLQIIYSYILDLRIKN